MSPKSGKAGSAVDPAAPKEAKEADKAESGEAQKFTASAAAAKKSKGDSNKTKPFKPPKTKEEKGRQTSWVEIVLVDDAGKPVAGERFEVTLPDNSVAEGTLDSNGFARVSGFEPGSCKVTFPDMDKDAWKKG